MNISAIINEHRYQIHTLIYRFHVKKSTEKRKVIINGFIWVDLFKRVSKSWKYFKTYSRTFIWMKQVDVEFADK